MRRVWVATALLWGVLIGYQAHANGEALAVDAVEAIVIDVFTRPVENMQIMAAVALDVPFETGGWTIYRGFGTCIPSSACSAIMAKDTGGRTLYFTKMTDFVQSFPARSAQAAVNMSVFALEHNEEFADLDCARAIHDGSHYQVLGSKKRVAVEQLTMRTEGEMFVVRQIEACRGEPDRLVRAEQVFDPKGVWHHREIDVMAEGALLPRTD